MQQLRFPEVRKHGIHEVESLVDLLTDLRAGEHDFAGDEDEQDNLGLHHAVDETGEEFGLVGAEHVMPAGQAFETDGEFDVARADNVLNLEIREAGGEAQLLNDSRVLSCGEFAAETS